MTLALFVRTVFVRLICMKYKQFLLEKGQPKRRFSCILIQKRRNKLAGQVGLLWFTNRAQIFLGDMAVQKRHCSVE